MAEQRLDRAETAEAPRVEYLLGVLRGMPPEDPSPALRDRLELLSTKQLRGGAKSGKQLGRARSGVLLWLRPAFVVLLVAIGIGAAFVVHVRRTERLRARMQPRVAPPNAAFSTGSRALPAAPSPEARLPETRHSLPKVAQNVTARQMVVRLPYSNNAINTGTDATIRVSMSQAELVSLGFPMNETLHDRRVVAELTLGDDGLPRAISVPLPLEVVREKK